MLPHTHLNQIKISFRQSNYVEILKNDNAIVILSDVIPICYILSSVSIVHFE